MSGGNVFQSVFVSIANGLLVSSTARRRFLRPARVHSGGWNLLFRGIAVAGPGRLSIGPGTFINRNCYFETEADVTIGGRVFVADHVRVRTTEGAPVTIGAGSWLGSGVVVMPGVDVGHGCVIGVNSVVTENLAADGLYIGDPATLRRMLG